MQAEILRVKIHRAEVTDAHLDYEGSLGIDSAFLEMTGLLPYEKVLVGNLANGHRFETYVIPAPAGSGAIVLNGAVCHLGQVGDLLVIMSYTWMEVADAARHQPRVLVLGDHNRTIRKLTPTP